MIPSVRFSGLFKLASVRIKICGITRVEDALAAAHAGADAIGLVFYAKSPRAVTTLQAREIIAALPPFVTTVGLLVNSSRCEINEILDAVPLDMLQFHGDETAADCSGFHRPFLKALRVKAGDDIAAQIAVIQRQQAFCLIPTLTVYQGALAQHLTGLWFRLICPARLYWLVV